MEGHLLSRFSRCLEEGIVTNNGPYVQEFEAVLSKYLRVPTICFSSGFTALQALLMAMDVGGGDVLYPAFTFPATPCAIKAAGARPVACDIDPATLTLSIADVASKIRRGTSAILAVDIYGVASVSTQLLDLATRWDIPLLVDAAPSFGTHVMGKPSTFLAPSIYSFHATKQLAVGEGGCLSSINHDLIKRAKQIRNFGLDGQIWSGPGINGKMTEISALIGLENMKTFRDRMLSRRIIKEKLDESLHCINHIRIIPEPRGQTVSWLYCPILIEEGAAVSRNGVVNLLVDRGIQTRTYYQSCSKGVPVAADIADRVIALPCHESMTDADIVSIKLAFLDILGGKE
jgi:dTDP-4-amino-4,6-dideoxyglucose